MKDYFVNRQSENLDTGRQTYRSRGFTEEWKAIEYYKLTVARAKQSVKKNRIVIHVSLNVSENGFFSECLRDERIL